MMLVDFPFKDEAINGGQCIRVPDFQAAVHAAGEEHSRIERIPLNAFDAVFVAMTTLAIDFANTLAGAL